MAGIPWGAIAEAVSVIATIASNPEALEQATKAADSAVKAVSAGVKAAGVAAEAAAPVARRAASAGSAAVDAAGKAASGVVERGGRVAGAAVGAVRGKRDSRDQRKALLEARRQILASASASLGAEQFLADWEAASAASLLLPLKSAGYYVLASYKGKPGKNDWGKYAEVYVGRSLDMGASVHGHLTGYGNPDVYADMKYGKYVHVFAFPDFDDTADKDETITSFSVALGAGDSYNARVLGAAGGGEGGAGAAGGAGGERPLQLEILTSIAQMEATTASLRSAFPGAALVEQELCGSGVARLRFSVSAGETRRLLPPNCLGHDD